MGTGPWALLILSSLDVALSSLDEHSLHLDSDTFQHKYVSSDG